MRRSFLFLLISTAVLLSSTPGAAGLPDDAAAVRHALNRLSYGPRPGDVERVAGIGLATWLDQQLRPARPNDAVATPPVPSTSPAPRGDARKEARREARREVGRLASDRLTRAIGSERQIEELLVDFWFNHFNVFAGKGRTAMYLPEYERTAIRPHVFGTFRDLLGATAHSPAMLFYLDNWLSVDPAAKAPGPRAQASGQRKRRGLNENYARELMELHTLGVDGGYTQQDIVNVARAFTGWTIDPRTQTFRFAPAFHDRGEKVVLGHTIKAGGGIEDGERVLDILASHPSTARFVATKLARRFVSDDPPDALIRRAEARFRETNGKIAEVVRTIVTSPEFFAPEARLAKVKTPLEFVVSAVRATNGDTANTRPLLQALRDLGMPLYMCLPPTGYDDTAAAWVSPGALVTRINVAQQIAGNRAAEVASPEFQKR
jgi:uncharacterized protein (DUF1800 family)